MRCRSVPRRCQKVLFIMLAHLACDWQADYRRRKVLPSVLRIAIMSLIVISYWRNHEPARPALLCCARRSQAFRPCRRGLLCLATHAVHPTQEIRGRAGCAPDRTQSTQCIADRGRRGGGGARARHAARSLRDQALEVCQMAGGGERTGFRATSLETLRHMVSANVGMTLLPMLTVQPPVPATPNVVLVPFADPAPHRRIAMVWRRTSALAAFLYQLMPLFKALPKGLLTAPPGLKRAR